MTGGHGALLKRVTGVTGVTGVTCALQKPRVFVTPLLKGGVFVTLAHKPRSVTSVTCVTQPPIGGVTRVTRNAGMRPCA